MRHSFLRRSKCIGSWLHRFKIAEEFPEGVLENCEICHKSVFYRVIDGALNNLDYMDFHIRNSLPSNHPLYFHEYHYEPYETGELSPIQI